jgi:predicted MPP superfamily phosphohydrolase
VLDRLLSEKADLILMAGDHLQEEHKPAMASLRDAFRTLVREAKISAPMGIYAVRGNIDWTDWARAFEGLPIVTIAKTQSIDVGELRLTGLSMEDSFNTHLSVIPSDRFQIVLGHSPDFALGQAQGDLLVAGHTHGGQVRLPGIGPIITECLIPRSWAAGVTNLTGGRTLVVSRGIGMERGPAPRLRFLCRPELVVIDIVP